MNHSSTTREGNSQKRILIPTLNIEKEKHLHKGFIVIPPQRHNRQGRYTKELKLITWCLSQILYDLHIMNLLPTGEGKVKHSFRN